MSQSTSDFAKHNLKLSMYTELKKAKNMLLVVSLLCLLPQALAMAKFYQGSETVQVVPEEYLVMLKSGEISTFSSISGIEVLRSYNIGNRRLAHVRVADNDFDILMDDKRVDFFEVNRLVQLDPMTEGDGERPSTMTPEQLRSEGKITQQEMETDKKSFPNDDFEVCNLHWYNPAINAWGIIRTSHRAIPNYSGWGQPYITGRTDTGQGTRIYIVDTGIYLEHPDFEGRAMAGMVSDGVGEDKAVDLSGHGTHVAGTAGGARYGIARDSTLVSCKVFNATGSASDAMIIQALEWAINDVTQQRNEGKAARGVINMSLGGLGGSFSMETVIHEAIELGIPVIVSAGNSDDDTCLYSPARTSDAITVGATDEWERLASFSNYGPCTDILAPGVWIAGPHRNGTFGDEFPFVLMSGTSMSAPHVSGIVARHMSALSDEQLQTISAAQIKARLNDDASNGRIFYEGSARTSTPNKLLYMGCGDGDAARPPPTTTTTTTTTVTPTTTTTTTTLPTPTTKDTATPPNPTGEDMYTGIITTTTVIDDNTTIAVESLRINEDNPTDDQPNDAVDIGWTSEAVSNLAMAGLILVCITFGTNLGTGIALWKFGR